MESGDNIDDRDKITSRKPVYYFFHQVHSKSRPKPMHTDRYSTSSTKSPQSTHECMNARRSKKCLVPNKTRTGKKKEPPYQKKKPNQKSTRTHHSTLPVLTAYSFWFTISQSLFDGIATPTSFILLLPALPPAIAIGALRLIPEVGPDPKLPALRRETEGGVGCEKL